ncbi:MAG: Hpt domain-containing protein [Pirellulaceae bacterium]|nr:Hpt domain-containing protein [Pirellulaceae bacterium]
MTSDRETSDGEIVDVHDEAITLDLGQARQNFGCDESLLQEIATVFIEDVPQIATELQEACSRNDVPTVCRLAHSLKGLCATFGAEPARTYAQHIEHEAASSSRAVVSHERVQILVHSLEQTIQTLRSELRTSI